MGGVSWLVTCAVGVYMARGGSDRIGSRVKEEGGARGGILTVLDAIVCVCVCVCMKAWNVYLSLPSSHTR